MQKYGVQNGKQKYKCFGCNRYFLSGSRLNSENIWEEYQKGKQTYQQLADKYGCSKRTIQRKIDDHKTVIEPKIARPVVVLTDTTYWGRGFGVMLFKDALSKENLLTYFVKTETNSQYTKGIKELQTKGFTIQGIVCDGRRGLIQSFETIPVQMCQFHQVAIIRKYLTKKPKLPASVELKAIVDLLKDTDKDSFEGALNDWFVKWESFLKQRTTNPETGKSHYTHKRLRSAYRSLKNNLPWLFTYQEDPSLNIPNTTNAIDGHFADLKNKLRNHNGLALKRKMRFIERFLKA